MSCKWVAFHWTILLNLSYCDLICSAPKISYMHRQGLRKVWGYLLGMSYSSLAIRRWGLVRSRLWEYNLEEYISLFVSALFSLSPHFPHPSPSTILFLPYSQTEPSETEPKKQKQKQNSSSFKLWLSVIVSQWQGSVPYFPYSLICWRIARLYPILGYCD